MNESKRKRVVLQIGDSVVEGDYIDGGIGMYVIDNLQSSDSGSVLLMGDEGVITLRSKRAVHEIQDDIMNRFFNIKSLASVGAQYVDGDVVKRDPQLCDTFDIVQLIQDKTEEIKNLILEIECSLDKSEESEEGNS